MDILIPPVLSSSELPHSGRSMAHLAGGGACMAEPTGPVQSLIGELSDLLLLGQYSQQPFVTRDVRAPPARNCFGRRRAFGGINQQMKREVVDRPGGGPRLSLRSSERVVPRASRRPDRCLLHPAVPN